MKRYKELLVNFEVAKLLKEKGFQLLCHSFFFEDGEFKEFEINETHGYYGDEYTVEMEEFYNNWNNKWKIKKDGNRCFGCSETKGYLETFSAPSLTIAQDWLREVHNIHITVASYEVDEEDSDSETFYEYFIRSKGQVETRYSDDMNSTYEMALGDAIIEGLKRIKS